MAAILSRLQYVNGHWFLYLLRHFVSQLELLITLTELVARGKYVIVSVFYQAVVSVDVEVFWMLKMKINCLTFGRHKSKQGNFIFRTRDDSLTRLQL